MKITLITLQSGRMGVLLFSPTVMAQDAYKVTRWQVGVFASILCPTELIAEISEIHRGLANTNSHCSYSGTSIFLPIHLAYHLATE